VIRVTQAGSVTFGVALSTGSSGDTISIATGVRATLPKANAVSTSAAVGDYAYWDATNSIVCVSASRRNRSSIEN
jgi:predicted RecA/RadA family phage recombinase